MAYYKEIPIRIEEAYCCGSRPIEMCSVTDSLYLTDDCRLARELQALGKAVLPVQPKDGEYKDFGGFSYIVEDPDEADAAYFEKVYKRIKGMPWLIVTTERTIVRESIPEDARNFFAIYEAPEVSGFLTDLHETLSEEKSYLADYAEKVYSFFEYGMWTVIDRQTGRVIGRAGFNPGEESSVPELGYVIEREMQGKGIAYEVCSALIAYGFEECGFEEIHAFVKAENLASRKLCERLGFAEGEVAERNNTSYIKMILNGPICRTEH